MAAPHGVCAHTPRHSSNAGRGHRQRAAGLVCRARPSAPYEPLERAIQVINRIIALGERSNWSGGEGAGGGYSGGASSDASQQAQERWVQFGAVYNSRLLVEQAGPQDGGSAGSAQPSQPLDDNSSSGGSTGSGTGGRQLSDYLALPVEQYSLLDPRWISREPQEGLFRFSLPLQDLVGVDLQPEITISVLSEPEQQRVTLAGTRAALGSPEIDAAFKLNVTAVVSQRQRRRLLPRPPDHLPGRPVYRLRRWAAAARGRTWPPPPQELQAEPASAVTQEQAALGMNGSTDSSSSSSSSAQTGGEPEVVVATTSSTAPFPEERVYFSHDENDSFDSDEYLEGAEGAAAVSDAYGGLAPTEAAAAAAAPAAPASSSGSESSSRDAAAAAGSVGVVVHNGATGSGRQGRGQPAVLHCRSHVTMAVRVPGPLRVVPNALLGYAGSMLLRTVLTAAQPSFLDLLASDYRRWAGLSDAGSASRDLDAPVGELFSDAAAAVQQGRERRRQLAEQGVAEHETTEHSSLP